MSLANTPEPPYYAAIFSSVRDGDDSDYDVMAVKMDALAKKQLGFLGFETARDAIGISVSYWESLEAIQEWKRNLDHQEAQQKGRSDWYKIYKVRIARVERAYSFNQ